jgi:hypothetical protein
VKDRSKPALCESTALLKEGLAVLDVDVSLVHNNEAECALACSIEEGLKHVGMVAETLEVQEHEVGVLTRSLH